MSRSRRVASVVLLAALAIGGIALGHQYSVADLDGAAAST
jgi:hypothetical protein